MLPIIKIALYAGLGLLLGACGDSNNNGNKNPDTPTEPSFTYSAEIRRTEYGIPHIKADDWGSLGYGYGYAYSQDNYCVTMREIVLATGRSAELMDGDPEEDLLFRFLNGSKEEFRAKFFDVQPQFAKDLATGYAAGMNRYLRETGVENLPEGEAGCRDAEWVFEIDEIDLMQYLRRIGLAGSSDQSIVRDALLAVQGPDSMDALAAVERLGVEAFPGRALAETGRSIRPSEVGSNAIALGGDATQNGGGLLLGNPHQPWSGSGRWYEAHLTIPGEYDVAGASLQGLPWIGIGFTRDVAWTHTVDYSTRFTLYELKLNPNNPLEYDYDGEWREITAQTVSVKVKMPDGSMGEQEKTFYSSHYGLIIDLGSVNPLLAGWPLFNGSLMSMRDANLDTGIRSAQQWVQKSQATNMAEFTEALKYIGNPVFHEFAADRHGDAFYGQITVVPHITQEQLDLCMVGIGALVASSTTNAIIGLDGSTSACEWGEDADTPAGTGLFGYEARPRISTRGYVANSNNSYWLSDANHPLTGYPVVLGWMGPENKQQFLRTRINHLMVADRLAGTDGLSETPLFDMTTLQGLMYSNRVYGAEIALDDTLEICAQYLESPPADADKDDTAALRETCRVLGDWDRKVELDSRGAQVFTEYWAAIRGELGSDFQNIVDSTRFWLVDFDPADPLNTPAGIDLAEADNHSTVIAALRQAYNRLTEAGVALDAPWGEVQFLERNNERVPIHGGAGTMGVFGAISASLQEGGYKNPSSGNSYIQTVTWDESDCPIADTILTHSQSVQPDSDHYGDQSTLYADKRWVRFPFCEEDIVAQQIGETLVLEE
ncbi:MAG: penicillin acylase family protein [Pseudomonadales bacterium]|nr:penicillin acylase family protein [Halioglobus sp.]MCP5128637.1 penicillin acylase family protein [Pseudomonadales bacterium]